VKDAAAVNICGYLTEVNNDKNECYLQLSNYSEMHVYELIYNTDCISVSAVEKLTRINQEN